MPRLFTGIEIPEDISQYLSLLKFGLHGARWISLENYHITLRFFGDIEQHIANELDQAIDNIEFDSFKIRVAGLGSFGGDKPRSIWAGIEADEDLVAIQKNHESAARHVGLPPESRNYTPHITLARLKGSNAFDVAKFLENYGEYQSQWFDVKRVVLYSSRTSRGGGPYAIEAHYPAINTFYES